VRFIGLAKGYRRRLNARDFLRSLGVVYDVEFRRPYVRSGSRRRMWVGGRR
jgi:hypothetical protein